MRDGAARDVALSGRERAAAHDGAPQRLGWDGIGAICVLLVSATAPRDWVSDPSVGQFLFRALWWLLYLATALRLVQRFGTEWLTWTIRHQPALCVLLTLTLASCLWSLAPTLTLHKSVSLVGTTVLGISIGYTLPPPRVMRVLHWTFTLLIVSSIVVVMLLPAPVLEAWEPIGWRGIMAHKNSFGAAAVFATVFFLISTLWRRIDPLWGITLCVIWLFALTQAHSRTCLVALGVSLIACAYLALARGRRLPTRAVLRRLSLGLVLGVSVIPFLIGPLAAILGDDDALNGRASIWDGARTILSERPVTGYGYAVVWGRSEATLLPHIAITANRSASSAHNSIVDVATELGIPAAVVACAYLLGAFFNAARLFERETSAFAVFALVFLIGFAVMSFSEAHLLRIHSLFWILFVAITVAVKRALTAGADDAAAAWTQIR